MPQRRTSHLRWGRISTPHATYFVTGCVQERRRIFIDTATIHQAHQALLAVTEAGDATVLAATLMPDHFHLLFTLGERLRLGQVVGKFKALTTRAVAACDWQQDGFEHQLRPAESAEDYGFYIFMNPYRAGLRSLTESWPGWFCPDPKRFEFPSHLGGGRGVPAEWVERSVRLGSRLGLRR